MTNLINEVYGTRAGGRAHGDVYTSVEIVRYILDLVGYTADKDLSVYTILEPSCGEGVFLVEIYQRLRASGEKYGFDYNNAFVNQVYACELDEYKLSKCIEAIKTINGDFVPLNFKNEDFLKTEWNQEFDYIVGNPPYIRYENIPQDKRNAYKSAYTSFHYRADLYILFYERSLSVKGRR